MAGGAAFTLAVIGGGLVFFHWYANSAIFGKVVDEAGEPVENAMVQLLSCRGPQARTGTENWFGASSLGIRALPASPVDANLCPDTIRQSGPGPAATRTVEGRAVQTGGGRVVTDPFPNRERRNPISKFPTR